MNCFKCGSIYHSEDNFCGECGIKLDVKIESPFHTQTGLNVEDIRSNLGTVYLKMGKYKKAKIEFEKVLEHNPNDSNAREMLEVIEKRNILTKKLSNDE